MTDVPTDPFCAAEVGEYHDGLVVDVTRCTLAAGHHLDQGRPQIHTDGRGFAWSCAPLPRTSPNGGSPR